MMVALAQILGYIKLWRMPWGGSVVLSMVPMVLYAVRWGLGPGILASFALGVLQFLLDGGFAIGWQSIVGDYLIALTVLGLAGLGRKKGFGGVIVGSLLGTVGRYFVVTFTGATLWGEYMHDLYFFHFTSTWTYSLIYNLPALISAVLVTVICVLLYRIPSTKRLLEGGDLN